MGALHQSQGEMASCFTDGFCRMCNEEGSFSINLICHLKTNNAPKKTEIYYEECRFALNGKTLDPKKNKGDKHKPACMSDVF